MTSPIRTTIHTLVEFPKDPGDMTLREAAEWFKGCVRGAEPLGMLTALEHKYMNERYAELCKQLAVKQGVPAGMLSYFIGELAQTEIQLADTATEELEAAKLLT